MKFSKKEIAEFKAKGRWYLTWRKNLKPYQIKKCFYNDNSEQYNIKTLFPDKNLEYYFSDVCEGIVDGDFMRGLKYVNETGTYYMFYSANTSWANPHNIAVGKLIEGKIYLIHEFFPTAYYNLDFMIIPKEYINTNRNRYLQVYNHRIFVVLERVEKAVEDITDEDVKCLRIAYDGIREFSKLIEKIY